MRNEAAKANSREEEGRYRRDEAGKKRGAGTCRDGRERGNEGK